MTTTISDRFTKYNINNSFLPLKKRHQTVKRRTKGITTDSIREDFWNGLTTL